MGVLWVRLECESNFFRLFCRVVPFLEYLENWTHQIGPLVEISYFVKMLQGTDSLYTEVVFCMITSFKRRFYLVVEVMNLNKTGVN